MSMYKITFTPSGPYFFGNEKTFKYEAESELYYITGEDTPSQNTIFGALRYILLPTKGLDKLTEPENIKAVGERGFNIDSKNKQVFGKIKGMSPVFVSKGEELFIPTPFDHNRKNCTVETEGDKKFVVYTPMTGFAGFETLEGEKLYLTDYDSKEGVENSYMSVETKRIITDLFGSDVRVGINRKNTKDGFFKKEYKYLETGYSFCVFAEIDDAQIDKDSVYCVCLGQGKVPFSARFEVADITFKDLYDKVCKAIGGKAVTKRRLYCLSDTLVDNGLYAGVDLAIVKTRDYRSFTRSVAGYKKNPVLHRLVKAGSVFYSETVSTDFIKNNEAQKNASTIGYNTVIGIDVV